MALRDMQVVHRSGEEVGWGGEVEDGLMSPPSFLPSSKVTSIQTYHSFGFFFKSIILLIETWAVPYLGLF